MGGCAITAAAKRAIERPNTSERISFLVYHATKWTEGLQPARTRQPSDWDGEVTTDISEANCILGRSDISANQIKNLKLSY